MLSKMDDDRDKLIIGLRDIVSSSTDRVSALRAAAESIKDFGRYRWVGLYDVDTVAGIVRNIVWSGPGAPEHPTFSITKGLTGSAISSGKAVNVGDVRTDARYLTAFGSTRSEIIIPVFDEAGKRVVGTVDVESEHRNAFGEDTEAFLLACAEVLRPLWCR
jgi:L-methionine (R)-S-oxide reductase